jgi:hypothetical protein
MKLNLGKTPEQQKAEEAKRQRELEASIQEKIMERQAKIQALHRKQTSNKIIIFSVSAIILVALIIFGTYNTFFKKGLTADDVNTQITQKTSTLYFPIEGVNEYIVDNSQVLFDKYIRLDPSYEYAKVDKNSIYIDKLIKKTSTFAMVYFSMDVEVKSFDTVVTDPEVIKQLQRNGFGVEPTTTTTTQPTQPTTPPATPTDGADGNDIQSAEPTSEEDVSNEEVSAEDMLNAETSEEVVTEEVTTETTEVVNEDVSMSANEISMSSGKGQDINEYYITSGGQIMQRGKTTVTRYEFCLPIELVNDKEKGVSYYRPASDMSIYSLIDPHQSEFEEIEVHSAFLFNEDTLVEESEKNAAKIKVDKTLSDLYNKRDTSQDFLNVRQFNTYDATYISLDTFELHTETNALGYNATVTYTIKTPQGFYYSVSTYLLVEKSGTSWVIKKML